MYTVTPNLTPPVHLGKLVPDGVTRESKMLAAGGLTVTVRSKKTGQHVTLRLRCKAKGDGGWKTVPFPDATHVFVDDFDGERVATYYPQDGKIRYREGALANARWTVQAVLRHYAGEMPTLPEQADLHAAEVCGACGKQLTDPESIERGIGPDCFGKLTKSKHAHIWE